MKNNEIHLCELSTVHAGCSYRMFNWEYFLCTYAGKKTGKDSGCPYMRREFFGGEQKERKK